MTSRPLVLAALLSAALLAGCGQKPLAMAPLAALGDVQAQATAAGAKVKAADAALAAWIKKEFAAADANHDGAIDAKEAQKGWGLKAKEVAKATADLDLDHNGRISEAELVQAFRNSAAQSTKEQLKQFAQADLDHNGVLDKSEIDKDPGVIIFKDGGTIGHVERITHADATAAMIIFSDELFTGMAIKDLIAMGKELQ